jgi:UDP-N-acetylglucosamine diphosphorylase/glucosamine-1-phosphate N-acetyltransferase
VKVAQVRAAPAAAPLFLYDDAAARRFAPFALTRPASELRVGMELVRRRWEICMARSADGAIAGGHLADFEEPGAPPVFTESTPDFVLRAGSIVANSRCAPRLVPNEARDADVWTCGGRVAAVRLGRDTPLAELGVGEVKLESLSIAGTRAAKIAGGWVEHVWSLVTGLGDQLIEDIGCVGPSLECELPAGAILLPGDGAIHVERGALVEPMVCFDTSAGPILIRKDAKVRAFTRLVGPLAVCGESSVLGGRVDCCAIGEASVVHGEISHSVILGHSNKSHDGFVGHSYLGRWVNLGAGTITSNLKNTYGCVQLWTPGGLRDTGEIKLGSFLGDHVKTGIGTRLTTGSVVGAGSNIYGGVIPPKYIPPFSWGEGDDLSMYRLDKFLSNTERVTSRRGVTLTEREKSQLDAAHAISRAERA